ncbi:hypothetical protein QTP88_017323 [Uroleucon formosanum]
MSNKRQLTLDNFMSSTSKKTTNAQSSSIGTVETNNINNNEQEISQELGITGTSSSNTIISLISRINDVGMFVKVDDILVKTLRPAATRTFLNIAMSIDVIEEKSLRNIPIPEDSTKDSRQSNVESVPADLQQTSTAMPIEIVTPKIN